MEVSGLTSIAVKVILVLLVIVFTSIYIYLRKDYGYWTKRGVRHAAPVFIFGNLEFVMRRSFWDFFYNLGKKFPEPYVGVFLGHKPALVIQNADIARKILVKDAANFEDRFIYADKDDRIGRLNLFSLKNPAWTDMRKQLSPMFTSSRLRTLSELMNFNSQELVKRIDREYIVQKRNPVHLKDLFSRYTSDTVGYTVFGLRTSALNEDKNPLWLISSLMVKWTFWRGFEFSIMFFVPAVASIFRLKFFSAAATEYVKKLFYTVVEEREKTGKKTDLDLVNQLQKIKENIQIPDNEDTGYPEDLMLGQVAIFILGAIETSSSTLIYCLHELSHHPNIQKKLYNEVDEAVQKAGRRVLTFDELINLHFLNSCIQETLRKHTPVPHIDRICAADYKIDDKLTIEKGTPVVINLEAIHHDEINYPKPSKWIPERFTGIAADSDNRNFTFLPFGEGPRFCIGKRYGMCQIRAALAQVVHKYWLEPAAPYEVPSDPYSLILSPKGGGVVKFVPRELNECLF